MSAYLNTGMVSPMRIARELCSQSGRGKSKYMNEFITWRGVSYSWCYYHNMGSGATLNLLPNWAKTTLTQHSEDERQEVLPMETLVQGKTGNRVWDAMQKYLVETGELHNNARMGWGKAILAWSESPEAALARLLDLNH